MDKKELFQLLVGQNIRYVRIQKNMTIEELALSSGLTYSQISRVELGKLNSTAYTLFLISLTLNVCPSEFFRNIKENINK